MHLCNCKKKVYMDSDIASGVEHCFGLKTDL